MTRAYHQPRGGHDPFSPHEPLRVGLPAVPDPSGDGGDQARAVAPSPASSPPADTTPPAAPVVKRRRANRRKTTKDDPELARELSGLERPE